MAQQFFVNIPVKDAKKSIQFWKQVGYSHNPQLVGDNFCCILFGENFFAMMLEYEVFNTFVPNPVTASAKNPTVVIGLACDSRADVHEKVERAVAAGAKRHGDPEDHGSMYQDAFIDPDGHGWAMTYMDPSFGQK